MARPGIDKQDYIQEIERQLSTGARLEEVTATKLQKAVGGQYSKAVEILNKYKEENKAADEDMPRPEWFKQWAEQITESAWLKISGDLREHLKEATSVFEKKRQDMERQQAEDHEQIRSLEAQVETLSKQLLEQQTENKRIEAELSNQVSTLQAQVAEGKDALAEAKATISSQSERLEEAAMLKGELKAKTDQVVSLEKQFSDLTKQISKNK